MNDSFLFTLLLNYCIKKTIKMIPNQLAQGNYANKNTNKKYKTHTNYLQNNYKPANYNSQSKPIQTQQKQHNKQILLQHQHIKIDGLQPNDYKKRRHRIFDDNSLLSNDSFGKNNRNRTVTIFGHEKTNKNNTSRHSVNNHRAKPTLDKTIQTHPKEQAISKKIPNYSYLDEGQIELKRQLIRKQLQINYLKLQIQRFKRCDNINSENQALYKRLVNQIKQPPNHTINQINYNNDSNSNKKIQEIHTPISSLTQLKFSSGNDKSKRQIQSISQNQLNQTHQLKPPKKASQPLKTIPENEELKQLPTQNKIESSPEKIIPTNQNQQNTVFKRTNSPTKNHNPSKTKQYDPIYQKIQQKLQNTKRRSKFTPNECSINTRLHEMNRVLENSLIKHSGSKLESDSNFSSRKRPNSGSKYSGSSHNRSNYYGSNNHNNFSLY